MSRPVFVGKIRMLHTVGEWLLTAAQIATLAVMAWALVGMLTGCAARLSDGQTTLEIDTRGDGARIGTTQTGSPIKGVGFDGKPVSEASQADVVMSMVLGAWEAAKSKRWGDAAKLLRAACAESMRRAEFAKRYGVASNLDVDGVIANAAKAEGELPR